MIQVCYTWGNAGIKWKNGDWTWDECQLVNDCVKWGDAGVLWMDANWIWAGCSGSVQPPIPPIPVISVSDSLQPPGVDAMTLVQPWLIEPHNPFRTGSLDKRKRMIKLICKVKGKVYEEEKEVENYKISVDDIRMVVKAVSNVNVGVRMED